MERQHHNWTINCTHPHSVMRDILSVGSKYKLSGNTTIVYQVIGIREYDNPYGYFSIRSRYYSRWSDDWQETNSHSGQLHAMYEKGQFIPIEGGLKPNKYMNKHSMI